MVDKISSGGFLSKKVSKQCFGYFAVNALVWPVTRREKPPGKGEERIY